jgi:MFS family permease
MTAQSKEGAEDDDAAVGHRMLKVIAPAVFLNVLSGAMLFTARPVFARKLFDSPQALTTFLTRLGSASALIEFLINPIFGKLSDTYGRRAIAPIGNFATMLARVCI